ncbi:zinc-binding dehydrogenase [Sphingorhabdus sp.]|jgi:NADPH2:quinone reductase|uniref:zinc-binding dehydrogenase n=1 Tax=Sphingorhabdus sp. TaxID=1902408 RepID=UPI0035AF6400
MTELPTTNRTMLTEVKPEGVLELYLADLPMPQPKDHEVLVKVLATPINPSDLGLMVGAADVASARAIKRDGLPGAAMDVPEAGMRFMASRVGQAMPIGNEGCGIVVAAGASEAAQALLGKTVAMIGGEIYAQYRCLAAMACMPLPDGTAPEDGASCFVNPLTSLGFVETMKLEGYKGIVHAAAASNLGQMLVKICKADGIPLVNIVRSQAQVDLLKGIGADIVLDSTSDDFAERLTQAIYETGAFIGFDPIGGGKISGQMLAAMEAAAVRRMTSYSRYGSDQMKQVYIYGALDVGPTILNRSFGLTWGLGGWLLTPFMAKAGAEVVGRMRARVAAELTTTFKSHYSHEVSLEQAVDVATIQAYNAKKTGEKYLIRP